MEKTIIRTLGARAAVLAVALALLAPAGCATRQYYSGERRPKDEVARITIGGWALSRRNLFIKSIDGRGEDRLVVRHGAEVLPGAHTIKVAAANQFVGTVGGLNPFEFFTLTLYAEAGHTYRLEWSGGEPPRPVLTDLGP